MNITKRMKRSICNCFTNVIILISMHNSSEHLNKEAEDMMKKMCVFMCIVLLLNTFTYAAIDPNISIETENRLPDMDIRVSFDQTIMHASENTDSITLKMFLNRASDETVTFEGATLDGSALSGLNYSPIFETITFLPGETEKAITIQIIGLSSSDFKGENLFYLSFSKIQNGLFEGNVTEKKIKVVLKKDLPIDVTNLMKLQSKSVEKGSVMDVSINCADIQYTNQSEIILVANFSKNIINSGVLSMAVNGTLLYPEESKGSVSRRLTFIYPVKESDFSPAKGKIAINIERMTNVGIPEIQKFYEQVNVRTAQVELQIDRHAESYLHDLQLTFTTDEAMNFHGHLSLEIFNFDVILEDLMNKVINRNDTSGYEDKLYFQVVAPDGQVINIDTFYQDTQSYQLYGDFILPSNKTGITQTYLARLVTENGVLPNHYTYFGVEPVVMIDDTSDLSILYTDWPPNDKTKIKEGIYRKLDYKVRDDATWRATGDFIWTSSKPEVASIDANGLIEIKKDGTVYFTLTALNDGQTENRFSVETPKLLIRELEQPYITIVDQDKNLCSNVSEDMTVQMGSNLTEHNFDAGFGETTDFTIYLYKVEHASNQKITKTLIHKEVITSHVDAPLAKFNISGELLNQIAPYGVSNYAVMVEADQKEKGKSFSDLAYLEIKSPPAVVNFDPLATHFFDDEKGFIALLWTMANLDTQNNLIESLLEVKIGGEVTPYYTESGFAAETGVSSFEPREVPDGVVREVYHVTLKVRNNARETWSEVDQTIYVYNHDALMPTIDGLPSEYLYMSNVEAISQMDVKQILALNRDIKLRADLSTNILNYALFGPDNNFSWTLDNPIVTSIRDQNDINLITFGSEYGSGEHFYLFGDADGISQIEAKHIYSSLTGNLSVKVDNLRDQLYLFDNIQHFPYTMRYTNGLGVTVETTSNRVFSGETAIYEPQGIASDVVISYVHGEDLYRKVIKQEELLSGEGSGEIKSLYPVNTFEMTTINDTELTIVDDKGLPYTGTVQLLGGVYVAGAYREDMLINGLGRYDHQSIPVVDGKINIKIDPVRLEKVNYNDAVEVKLQIRDEGQAYYPIFDFYGGAGTTVQDFSKNIHTLSFKPYLLNRKDHSIFDAYQIINQSYHYPNGIKNSITNNVDYLYVDQLNQAVTVYSQILIPKTTQDKKVSVEAYVIDSHGEKIIMDTISLNRYEGDYPFADLQIYDYTYAYKETSFADMKLASGAHYPVHINVKIEQETEVSHALRYQLLNLNGITTVSQTYSTFATDYYEELKGYVDFSSYVENLSVNGYVKDLIRTIAFGNAAPASNRVAFVIEPGDGLLKYKAVLAFVLDDRLELLKGYGIGTYFYDLLSLNNTRPATPVSTLTATLDRIIENYSPMSNTLKQGDPNFKVEGYGYITYEIRYDVNSKTWKAELINYNTTLSGAMKKEHKQKYFSKSYDLIVAEPTLDVTGTTTLSALINYRGTLKEHVSPLYDYAILYSPSIAGTISYNAECALKVANVDAGLEGGVTGTATVGYTHRFYESDDPVINDKNSGELKVLGSIEAYFKAWAPAIDTYRDSWELYSLTFGPYRFADNAAWTSQYANYINATTPSTLASQLRLAAFEDPSLVAMNTPQEQRISEGLSAKLEQIGELSSYEISVMEDGTTGIAYVLAGDTDVRLIVVNPSGEIIKNEKITNNMYSKKSVHITAVTENGEGRFVVGYRYKDALDQPRLNLHLYDTLGTEVAEGFQQLSGFVGENFVFSKEATELSSLYLLWNVVETAYIDDKTTPSTHDVLYASRFAYDNGWFLSYPLTVAVLDTNTYFEAYTGISTGKALQVNYVAKTTTENGEYLSSDEVEVALADAIDVKSVYFNPNEVYENHDVYFEFNVQNHGYRLIDTLDVKLENKSYHFDLETPIKPGEIASLVLRHPLNVLSSELDYTVTATVGDATATDIGQVNLDYLNIDLGSIEQLKATNKERLYNISLKSTSSKKLVAGEHKIVLGIYTDMFNLNQPVKEVFIEDQPSLDAILKGQFSTTLSLKDELMPYLSPEGEIPDDQLSFYVIASLVEEDETPQIMDRGVLKVKSLLEKSNRDIFTYDAILRYGSKTTIDLNLFNHSMNTFTGDVTVQLFDKDNKLVGKIPLSVGDSSVVISGESERQFAVETDLTFETMKLTWSK